MDTALVNNIVLPQYYIVLSWKLIVWQHFEKFFSIFKGLKHFLNIIYLNEFLDVILIITLFQNKL